MWIRREVPSGASEPEGGDRRADSRGVVIGTVTTCGPPDLESFSLDDDTEKVDTEEFTPARVVQAYPVTWSRSNLVITV